MKKLLLAVVLLCGCTMMAKAEVEFAYDAGFEVVSAYIWRGQYNGGLSFQPDLEIGYDGELTSFRAGVWGNIGASDWRFKRGADTYIDEDGVEIDPNTRFMPELDVMLNFSVVGLSVGLNHYYYCDGLNFLGWMKDSKMFDIDGNARTGSTTEFWAGYSFEHFFEVDAYINWYTTFAGNDFIVNDDDAITRAWSSYIEMGYNYNWEDLGLTLGAQLGISPWKSDLYGNSKFAVTNISLRLDKEWEFDHVTLDLFAQGSLNPDGVNKGNAYIKGSGDEKLYNQKLNGVLGLGVWF